MLARCSVIVPTPHPALGARYIYSDAADHHIMSDLSAFIGDDRPGSHRILAAGDLNNIYGATEDNPNCLWYQRDKRRLRAHGRAGTGVHGPAVSGWASG